jgi:hypothetical protein
MKHSDSDTLTFREAIDILTHEDCRKSRSIRQLREAIEGTLAAAVEQVGFELIPWDEFGGGMPIGFIVINDRDHGGPVESFWEESFQQRVVIRNPWTVGFGQRRPRLVRATRRLCYMLDSLAAIMPPMHFPKHITKQRKVLQTEEE